MPLFHQQFAQPFPVMGIGHITVWGPRMTSTAEHKCGTLYLQHSNSQLHLTALLLLSPKTAILFGQPQKCKLIKAIITQSASCIHLQPVLGRFLNKCLLVLSQGRCSCLFPAWIAVVASACSRRLSTQPVGLQGQYIS